MLKLMIILWEIFWNMGLENSRWFDIFSFYGYWRTSCDGTYKRKCGSKSYSAPLILGRIKGTKLDGLVTWSQIKQAGVRNRPVARNRKQYKPRCCGMPLRRANAEDPHEVGLKEKWMTVRTEDKVTDLEKSIKFTWTISTCLLYSSISCNLISALPNPFISFLLQVLSSPVTS